MRFVVGFELALLGSAQVVLLCHVCDDYAQPEDVQEYQIKRLRSGCPYRYVNAIEQTHVSDKVISMQTNDPGNEEMMMRMTMTTTMRLGFSRQEHAHQTQKQQQEHQDTH